MTKITNKAKAVFSVEDKLSEISDTLVAISSSLEGINELGFMWMQPRIISALSKIFPSPKQLKAYLLSDGSRSTREIGKTIGVSNVTIKNWWDKWDKDFQIVVQDSIGGSFRKLYSIGDLFIIFGNEETELKDTDDDNTK